MGDFQAPQRVKTALDNNTMKLYADAIEGSGGKSPSLTLYHINNNPRIDVWTQVQNDKDKGLIRAKISNKQLYQIYYILQMLINKPEDDRVFVIEVKSHTFNPSAGGRSKEAVLSESIYLGRSKEGEIFISIISADNSRPKIRFMFREDRYHPIGLRSGVLTKAESSNIAAFSWAECVKNLYAGVAVNEYTHEDRSQNGKGGKGGAGGGNNRGGGGGYNKGGNSGGGGYDDGDDDLPFD